MSEIYRGMSEEWWCQNDDEIRQTVAKIRPFEQQSRESRTSEEPSADTVSWVRGRNEVFRCNMLNMRERSLGEETRSPSERLPASGKTDSGSAVKIRPDGGMSSPSADRLLHRWFECNRADSPEGLSAPSPFACNNLPGFCVSSCTAPLEAIHLVFDISSRATGRTGTNGWWLLKCFISPKPWR
jgi:hypothetical protein